VSLSLGGLAGVFCKDVSVDVPIDVCHVASVATASQANYVLPEPLFEPKRARSLSPPRSYMEYFNKIMPWSDDEETSSSPTRAKSPREFRKSTQSPSDTMTERAQFLSISPPPAPVAVCTETPLRSQYAAPLRQTRGRRGKPLPQIPVNNDGLGFVFGIARDVIGYAVGSLSSAAEGYEENDRRPQMFPEIDGMLA
jgi:hypothetical protein